MPLLFTGDDGGTAPGRHRRGRGAGAGGPGRGGAERRGPAGRDPGHEAGREAAPRDPARRNPAGRGSARRGVLSDQPDVTVRDPGEGPLSDYVEVEPVPRIVLSDSAAERAGATDENLRFEGLARDCLEECRRELMMSFRFLSVALWHMPTRVESGMPPLATDGRAIYFDPAQTVLLYRHKPALLARTYLHLILHCIFRHPFDRSDIEPRALSIASDLIVEATALDMCDGRYECDGDEQRRAIIDQLAARFGDFRPRTVTRAVSASYERARGIVRAGGGDSGVALLTAEELAEVDRLFEFDSHRKWECYRNDDETGDGEDRNVSGNPENSDEGQSGSGDTPKAQDAGEGSPDEGDAGEDDAGGSGAQGRSDGEDETAGSGGAGGGSAEDADDSDDGEDAQSESGDAGEGAEDDADDDGEGEDGGAGEPDEPENRDQGQPDSPDDDEPDEAEDDWDEIARQVEMELRSHKAQWGDEAGELSALLQIQNRKRYDYAEFLRRFATVQEEMRLSDDEFDYIYYTYGLRRYGNMPLIEPVEYTESRRIREFAIVIDTSESCSGELVTGFIQRTYEILKETESFFSEVNIHIVQCDARVQQDTKIESLDDLERYLLEFEIFGLGGTDFRPAFAYVDELVEEGEFENLQGLIYFTDGRGTYPTEQPDYDTAFVFLSDGAERVRIPPWAMKVVMDEQEILDL